MKTYKYLLFPLIALTTTTLASCQHRTDFDEATTICVEPKNSSGFGAEWITKLAADWKAETGYNFDVKVIDSNNDPANQLTNIKANNSYTDIFFGITPHYKKGFYLDYFEDLTDMLDVKPDGEDGLTIKEKIINFDSWKKTASKLLWNEENQTWEQEGFYMLPFHSTITGFVFDYDMFERNGWLKDAKNDEGTKTALSEQGITFEVSNNKLIYKGGNSHYYDIGDVIKTCGKDGKYGTYDDGQVTTTQEFYNLCLEMYSVVSANGALPFIYSTVGTYQDGGVVAALAQIAGLDAMDGVTHFDSNGNEVELYDGRKVVITEENGYEAYKAKGVKEALDYYSNLNFKKFNNETMLYRTKSSIQNVHYEFVNGPINGTYYPFVYEGNWFENQAKDRMSAVEKQRSNNGLPAKADYRYYLTPDFEGQKGIDGNGHGTCFSAPGFGAMVVRKQKSADKLEAIKSFLTYILRNDSLAYADYSCGLISQYKFDLSDAQRNSMSRFALATYDIFQDTDNCAVISAPSDMLMSPVTYGSTQFPEYCFYGNINGASISAASMLTGYQRSYPTSEAMAQVIYNNYTKAKWENLVSSARLSCKK